MKILAGSSHTLLATNLAKQLNTSLVDREISHFSNNEKKIWIKQDLEDEQIILLQSFTEPVDEMIIETLLLIDALKRLKVKDITLIIPWMGYSLQNKAFRKGESNSAQVIAELISNTKIQQVILVDIHNPEILEFFNIPVKQISAHQLLVEYIQSNISLKDAIMVAPDHGSLAKTQKFAQILNLKIATINKKRDRSTGKISITDFQGDVKNKNALIVDDVVVTGGTAIQAAEHLKQNGANQIYFLATHGLFTDNATDKIKRSAISQTIITNTIEHQQLPSNIKTLDLAPILAQEIKNLL